MSENKKFYWLKLPKDWFAGKAVKRLRKLAGGDTYTIIYLKMLLKSLQDDGKLYFEGVDDSFEEELALDIDEQPDDVKMTIAFLIKCGLLVACNEFEYELTEVNEMTGSETASTRRSRLSRERQKVLQCNTNATPTQQIATKCNTEKEKEKDIELEKEKEKKLDKEKSIYTDVDTSDTPAPKSKKQSKHKYGEYSNVLLTDSERDKLFSEYGEDATMQAIKLLDESIEMKGYKYKSHYLAMRKWVFNALKENRRIEKRNTRDVIDIDAPIQSMDEWLKDNGITTETDDAFKIFGGE